MAETVAAIAAAFTVTITVSASTMAAITTAITVAKTVALIASIASTAISLTQKPPQMESAGIPINSQLAGPAGFRPVVFGRTGYGGQMVLREADDFGGNGRPGWSNKYYYSASVLSLGPIYGWESSSIENRRLYTDRDPVRRGNTTGLSFVTGADGLDSGSGLYGEQGLGIAVTLGALDDTRTFSSLIGGGIQAHGHNGASGHMKGLAVRAYRGFLNKKASNMSAEPMGTDVIAGQLLYDPRKDSSGNWGGSGNHRFGDVSTYEYSANAGLCALNYALGRVHNGMPLWGLQGKISDIDIPSFITCANVCDQNNWLVSGVISTLDSRIAVLSNMLAAAGSVAVQTGSKLGCYTHAPKPVTMTIKSDDVVSLNLRTSTSQKDRINRVIGRYREENAFWEIVESDPVANSTALAEDNGQVRTDTYELPLVPHPTQSKQLAGYMLLNSRNKGFTVDIEGPPRLLNAKIGKAVIVDLPEYGIPNRKMLVTGSNYSVGEQKVTVNLQAEDDTSHQWALTQTGTPPASPSLTNFDRTSPPAPNSTAWNVTGLSVTNAEGASTPAIVITGESDFLYAEKVQFYVRLLGSTVWTSAGEIGGSDTRFVISPLAAGQVYEAGVSYLTAGGYQSPITALPSVTVGDQIASTVQPGGIDWGSPVGTNPIINVPPALTELDGDGHLLPGNVSVGNGQTLDAYTVAAKQITNNLAEADAALARAQTALGGRIDAANQAIDGGLGSLDGKIEAAKTALNGAVSDLDGRLDSAEATILSDGSRLTSIGNRVTTVENGKTSVTDFNALKLRTDTAEGTLNAHTASLTTIGTDLAGKASASTVNDLVARKTTLPNLITNGGFTDGTKHWEAATGAGTFTPQLDPRIGAYGSYSTGFITSDIYPINAGDTLSFSFDGEAGGGNANVSIQWVPSYVQVGHVSFEPQVWETRKRSEGHVAPAGTTGFRIASNLNSSPRVNIARVKANYGAKALDYSDERTAWDSQGRITRLDKVTTDGTFASAQSVTDLTSRVSSAEQVNTAQSTRLDTTEVELGKKAAASSLTALAARVDTAEQSNSAQNTRLDTAEVEIGKKASSTSVEKLEASTRSVPNLQRNGDFTEGSVGWGLDGAGAINHFVHSTLGSIGFFTSEYIYTQEHPCSPGETFSYSYESDGGYSRLQWLPSFTPTPALQGSGDWLKRNKAEGLTAPAGATAFRVVFYKSADTPQCHLSRVKINYGAVAGNWSNEATFIDTNSRITEIKTATTDGRFAESAKLTELTAAVGTGNGTPLSSRMLSNEQTTASLATNKAEATRVALLETKQQIKPNLLGNGTGQHGVKYWTNNGNTFQVKANTVTGQGPCFYAQVFNGNSGQNASHYSDNIPVSDYSRYSFQAEMISGQILSGSVRAYIVWRNASGNAAGFTVLERTASEGGDWLLKTAENILPPSGTTYAQVYVDTYLATWGPSGTAYWRRLKLEQNSVCSSWSDETSSTFLNSRVVSTENAVNDGRFASAQSLTDLTTRVSTAEQTNTSQNTRLAQAETDISGKASATTVTNLAAQNRSVPNLLKNGDFVNGISGWGKDEAGTFSWYTHSTLGNLGYFEGANYVYSDPMPCNPGDALSYSYESDTGYSRIQWLPTYGATGAVYSNNTWMSRSKNENLIVPSGVNQFRLLFYRDGQARMHFSRVKVNYGPVAGNWSNEATAIETNARLNTVEKVTTDGTFSSASRTTALETSVNAPSGGVANLGARMGTVEQAVTDGRFSSATRVSTLESKGRTIPNKLINSDFSNGFRGWQNPSSLSTTQYDTNVGAYCSIGTNATFIVSDYFQVSPNTEYCFSFEGDGGSNPAGTAVYVQEWTGPGTGTVTADGKGGTSADGAGWFNRKYSNGWTTAPNSAWARLVVNKGSSSYFNISRIMLHYGSGQVQWNDDATVRDSVARITSTESVATDAQGRSKAIVGVNLDVNGYVSGWTGTNNGTSADFTITADKFRIVAPAGGARTEYSGGIWYAYTADNSIRRMWGRPFGSELLTDWTGPNSVAYGSETKASAYVYTSMTTAGGPRFGGSDTPYTTGPTGFVVSTASPFNSAMNSKSAFMSVNLTGPAPVGEVFYRWKQVYGDTCTISSPTSSGSTVVMQGNNAGGMGGFECTVYDQNQSKTVAVRVFFNSNV